MNGYKDIYTGQEDLTEKLPSLNNTSISSLIFPSAVFLQMSAWRQTKYFLLFPWTSHGRKQYHGSPSLEGYIFLYQECPNVLVYQVPPLRIEVG